MVRLAEQVSAWDLVRLFCGAYQGAMEMLHLGGQRVTVNVSFYSRDAKEERKSPGNNWYYLLWLFTNSSSQRGFIIAWNVEYFFTEARAKRKPISPTSIVQQWVNTLSLWIRGEAKTSTWQYQPSDLRMMKFYMEPLQSQSNNPSNSIITSNYTMHKETLKL